MGFFCTLYLICFEARFHSAFQPWPWAHHIAQGGLEFLTSPPPQPHYRCVWQASWNSLFFACADFIARKSWFDNYSSPLVYINHDRNIYATIIKVFSQINAAACKGGVVSSWKQVAFSRGIYNCSLGNGQCLNLAYDRGLGGGFSKLFVWIFFVYSPTSSRLSVSR